MLHFSLVLSQMNFEFWSGWLSFYIITMAMYAMCVAMAMQCIAIQCRHLTFPTTLWDNIWWQHRKMQPGVHQFFKSSHKPQQMFVLFVIYTSTLTSWPSSQVLKLILSQHQSRRPRGLLSCVMCMLCGPAVSKLDLNSMCENDLPIYCHWEKSRYI